MTRRALLIGMAFLILNGGLLAVWTGRQRETLEGIGAADADAVSGFVVDHDAAELTAEPAQAELADLVTERKLRGAVVLNPDGSVLVAAGTVDADALTAAKPGAEHAQAAKSIVVQVAVPSSSLRAVAFLDRAPIAAKWASVRHRAALAALLAVLFSPIIGVVGGKFVGARRAARST